MDIREESTFFVDGKFIAPAGAGRLNVVNPANLEIVGSVPVSEPSDIDRAVGAARAAFDHGPWGRTSPQERAEILRSIADKVDARFEELLTTVVQEMGTPIGYQRKGQAQCATQLRYNAGLAESLPFEEPRVGLLGPALVRREPVGVAALIIPWNAPLMLLISKLAAALAAGCTVVAKPASETPLDSYIVAEIIDGLDLPPGVVNIVPGGADVGDYLARHPGVDKVSFTGSARAGRQVMASCAERLARVTLELGGKSASIILEDADLDQATRVTFDSDFRNNGQACVSLSRVLAPRKHYEEIVERMKNLAQTMRIGDPMDPNTELGPLVSERQRDRVEGYIKAGLRDGANMVTGGGRPSGRDRGWWIEPTVFRDVENSMEIAREEIFGPVSSIIPYDSESDAIAIANDSQYGLAGAVFSADVERATEVARQIRTGSISVNGHRLEAGLPFGGFKLSGIGREWGLEGLAGFQEIKTIHLPITS
jgi:aldehyde dehydrogenase (NAD+)